MGCSLSGESRKGILCHGDYIFRGEMGIEEENRNERGVGKFFTTCPKLRLTRSNPFPRIKLFNIGTTCVIYIFMFSASGSNLESPRFL